MDTSTTLLEFFKALADPNRLKIVGLLAQEPRSGEELAELLTLQASTVSHHLKRLADAGLVSAKNEGYYSIYRLETDVLQQTAKALLQQERLGDLAADIDLDAYERKVLRNFTDDGGRITSFPTQQKKYLAVLKYVLSAFEPGKRYSEKEVNERLERFNEDTARMRRSLVDFGFMKREKDGGAYWLAES